MGFKEIFEGFDPEQHRAEVERRWAGTDPYREAARRTGGYSRDDWMRIKAENDSILDRLAEKLNGGIAADDSSVVDLAEEHRLHIDRWYYPCSRFMHARLAEMYVGDERFAESFEKRGQGLAAFLARAIEANLSTG